MSQLSNLYVCILAEILSEWDGEYLAVEDVIEGLYHDFTYKADQAPEKRDLDTADELIIDWFYRCQNLGTECTVFPGGRPFAAEFKLGDFVGLMIEDRIWPGIVVFKNYDRDTDQWLYTLQCYSMISYSPAQKKLSLCLRATVTERDLGSARAISD